MEFVGTPEFRPRMLNLPQLNPQPFIESRINQGMVTMVDPADLENGALQRAKNAVVRFDKTSRRSGCSLITPTKPDSEPVLKFETFKKKDGSVYTIRFTPTSLFRYGDPWIEITGSGLSGDQLDRFQTAIVNDSYVFANNGADYIQEIDPDAHTYARLGNAPKYRYITAFNNRLIGAALRDENEVEIGWSGNGNYSEWDPVTDETAGQTFLYESPADLNDWIKGIFAFTAVVVVVRERSVWIGNRTPVPQLPFSFYAAVPGIGSDCPHSICMIGDGIAWLDTRTKTVYAYSPNGSIEPIGRPIEKTLLDAIDDPEQVFSSYDPVENEYGIHFPIVGGGIRSWVFNRRAKAWTYNERGDLTFEGDTELGFGGVTIDELGTRTIESLGDTEINDLSPHNVDRSIHVYGRSDGEIAVIDPIAVEDIDETYETDLTSKVYVLPRDMEMVSELKLDFIFHVGGTIKFWYSKTGGYGIDPWILHKSIRVTELETPVLLRLKKAIRCRKFAWRITSEDGIWDIINQELYIYASGDARR